MHTDMCTFMVISEWIVLRTSNLLDENSKEIKRHFKFYNFFVRKPCRLWDNVEKYGKAAQATGDNMARAHCVLGNQGYKHTLTIYNNYWFSTATMFMLMRLNITLHWLLCVALCTGHWLLCVALCTGHWLLCVALCTGHWLLCVALCTVHWLLCVALCTVHWLLCVALCVLTVLLHL